MVRILVFGASITYGAWDKEGGWVQRLRKFLDEKHFADPNFHCRIYNLGISGNTTGDLLERFEFETKQRIKSKEREDRVIIFSIGGNDSLLVISKNGLRTNPEKFKENIQKLIELAKKFTSKIIFLGLTPADEARTTPIPWDTDKIFYKNENIKKYNEIIKFTCKENKIYFIEIFEDWINLDYKNLLEDGQHPTSEGHQKIFRTVKDFLIQEKII